MKPFFAHSGSATDPLDWQELPEHLTNVAKSASEKASRFGLSRSAHLAGLFHDLGKYDLAFQRKLAGEVNRVDHSTAGAVVLLDQAHGKDCIPVEMIAYAILGHHAGLPDFDTSELSSLRRRQEGYNDYYRMIALTLEQQSAQRGFSYGKHPRRLTAGWLMARP